MSRAKVAAGGQVPKAKLAVLKITEGKAKLAAFAPAPKAKLTVLRIVWDKLKFALDDLFLKAKLKSFFAVMSLFNSRVSSKLSSTSDRYHL